jgi:hypothetical protein
MSPKSATSLTGHRSRSFRSVTAYKPTSRSVQHKRSTAARNLPYQLVSRPKLSPVYRPSHLSQPAPLAPGLQSLPLSVYTLPTTSMSSPCMSWPSGRISLHLRISCPSGWSLGLQDGARVSLVLDLDVYPVGLLCQGIDGYATRGKYNSERASWRSRTRSKQREQMMCNEHNDNYGDSTSI